MNDVAHRDTADLGTDQPVAYPPVGLLIDGEWIHDGRDTLEITNPSDDRVIGHLPLATSADLDRALAAAERGFALWSRESAAERSALLHRTAALVRERIEHFAATITLEQGKPLASARGEVIRSASFLDWDAEQILRHYGRIVPSPRSRQQIVVREPVGPVAAFTPWNVPLSAPSRKISGALAAGCSVVIKPAEETPATACLFAQCFIDAGLPPGVLNVVHGVPAEVSKRLLLSPVIRMVTLTGSVGVGKALARLAAEGVKPALMELGGHAPVLIDADVDPANVAKLAATSKFMLAGQYCAAPTRFLVHRDVYGDFVSAFAREADAIKVGDGFDPTTVMGPLANERRVDAISHLVDDAVGRGAKLLAGGRRIGNRGSFYTPTVLGDVPLDAAAMTVEPFGPLALCLPVADMDEAVSVANSADVGLAGYVFTNAIDRLDDLCDRLECGVIGANGFSQSDADAEFGGVKETGGGREGGERGIDAYLVTKTVIRHAVRV